MRILAGTDLRPVALPKIPEGYRWVVEKEYDDYMNVFLQERKTVTPWWGGKGRVTWKRVDSEYIPPSTLKGSGSATRRPVVELVEQAAKDIARRHIQRLEISLEQELVVGIYEQGTKQALS